MGKASPERKKESFEMGTEFPGEKEKENPGAKEALFDSFSAQKVKGSSPFFSLLLSSEKAELFDDGTGGVREDWNKDFHCWISGQNSSFWAARGWVRGGTD